MKKGCFLALGVLVLSFFLVQTSSVQAEGSSISSPVYLKINDYYILYTDPAPPFIDEQDRALVPLRSVSDLMGAAVHYDAEHKTATIELGSDSVQLTAGSTEVKENEEIWQMDTVPVVLKQSMFIPVRVLIEAFDLVEAWDASNHILALTDERFKNAAIEDYRERVLSKTKAADDNAFVPQSFELQYRTSERELRGETIPWLDHELSVNMKSNIPKDLSAEEVDIHVFLSTFGGTVHSQHNEAVESKGSFTVASEGGGGASLWESAEMKFIVLFPRMLFH